MSERQRSAPLPAAERFVRRFRAAWARAELVRALVLAVGVWLACSAALVAIDLAWPLGAGVRGVLRLAPFLGAAGVLAWRGVRVVRTSSVGRFALRAEEELPQLEQYLTTALEAPAGDGAAALFRARAEERLRLLEPLARASWRVRRAAMLAGGAALLLFALVLLGGPAHVLARWLSPADAAAATPRGGADAGAPLPPEVRGAVRVEGVRWRVTPPAYTGLPAEEHGDVATIAALPGSRLELRGAAPPAGVSVLARVVGGGTLAATPDGSAWRATWTLAVGERGVAIELLDGDDVLARRVVPILAREDTPPQVRLLEPDADLVVGSATGQVTLRATARDDLGVADFSLTWIHTSGSGESFSFRQGDWAFDRVTPDGPAVSGEKRLDLGTTGLQPGDVLHVRAVARDRNDVTGPGTGVSNTRVIRVARAGEEAEITTLIGFPIEAEDDPVLSQRMIILLTERLRDRRAALARPALLRESSGIATEQQRLRNAVGEEVFVRLSADEEAAPVETGFRLRDLPGVVDRAESAGAHAGHDHGPVRPARADSAMTDEQRMAALLAAASRATGTGNPEEEAHVHDQSPIMSMNPVKLAAFNAMWAAERELRQGELDAALVHEYRALELMQQLREAERVFVRGTQRVAPIDVAAARGTGTLRDAGPVARSVGARAPDARASLAELEALLDGLRTRPAQESSVALAGLAMRLLAAGGGAATVAHAAALISEAAAAAGQGDLDRVTALAVRARAALAPGTAAGTAPPLRGAPTPAAAAYFERLRGGGR